MPVLRFLASALAQGVTGARKGQVDRERLNTQAARTASEAEAKRRHEEALERFQMEQINVRKSELEDKRSEREAQHARDEQQAEKERLEIDRLRHPEKYRAAPQAPAPSYSDRQKMAAMAYRDSLLKQPGMTIERANEMMKTRYPLVYSPFDPLDAKIGASVTGP